MRPRPLSLRTLLVLAAACLAACVNGSGGHGPALPEGHYFLMGSFDVDYAYERFFVVQADNRYEWVEYGVNAATSKVCKVTRHAGTYSLGESRLDLVREQDAGPAVKCGFTAADFRAMEWTDRKEAESLSFEIRNAGDEGFEAKDFFSPGSGYKALTPEADPFGFYE